MEGTKEDESLIHGYLKDYLYAGREWFNLTSEVIEFIENTNTIEEIREKIDPSILLNDNQVRLNKSIILYSIIPAIIYFDKVELDKVDYYILYNKLYDLLNNIDYTTKYEEDIFSFIVSHGFCQSLDISKIKELYEQNKSKTDINFRKDYDNTFDFRNRLRLLCSYLFEGNDIENVRYFVDHRIINSYLLLGPEKCRALSYDSSLIKKEVEVRMFDKNTVLSNVYSLFAEGDKYSKKELKDKLINLYQLIGYKKVPKATDLEEWFELKSIKVKDETGKWIHGFELIRKK